MTDEHDFEPYPVFVGYETLIASERPLVQQCGPSPHDLMSFNIPAVVVPRARWEAMLQRQRTYQEPCNNTAWAERRQWRPIDTAPRDGSVFLLRSDDGTVETARYYPEAECLCWSLDGEPIARDRSDATHWMPLPEPPA